MPSSEVLVNKVIVHPLVLLSVVDHFNRMGKIGNQKRVVGVLLGCWRSKGVLDISNSFAVPFDEDDKDKSVWFLDHDYLENMYGMFKKVNAKERVVGWYHTGPKLHQNDIAINELIRRYCPNSVLVIIDAKPKDLGLPTEAYIAVEEVHDDGSPTSKTFEHVPSEIGAEEAEEVGVEHLLRDIKDTTVGSLSQKITNQLMGLRGLKDQLDDIKSYLQRVGDGKMPINYQIVYQLQDIFNLLPDLTNDQFTETMYVKTNDQMLVVYLASMVRSIIALHNLINNKLANRDAEEGKDKKTDDKTKESKEKENKDTKDKKGGSDSEKTDKSKDDTNSKSSKK
ncbi:26S proteasome non-ATPase regulatory subunit 7 [Calliphora vicina]|uniref:26S proteasome non-ATPase regulatory subunit 7 n=1 Tax=Calliphora vicina TaxID=7373 RepID=UPI00325AC68B